MNEAEALSLVLLSDTQFLLSLMRESLERAERCINRSEKCATRS
jgi:hypothetical protein